MNNMTPSDLPQITFLDFLLALANNKKYIVLVPLVCGLITLGVNFTISPTFVARAVIVAPQQQQSAAMSVLQSLGQVGGVAATATGIKNPIDQFVSLLKSRSVQEKLVNQFNLKNRYGKKYVDDAIQTLNSNTNIAAGKDSLIVIAVLDKDPNTAADMANAYISCFSELLNNLALSESAQRRIFFQKQVDDVKNNLAKSQKELEQAKVGAEIYKANPQSASLEYAKMQAQIAAQRIKIAGIRQFATGSSPFLKQAESELIAMEVEFQRASSVTEGGEYIKKYRDFKYFESLLEMYLKQLEIARIDEAKEGPIIQVVDKATPPEKKTYPKKALNSVLITALTFVCMVVWTLTQMAWNVYAADPRLTQKFDQLRNLK